MSVGGWLLSVFPLGSGGGGWGAKLVVWEKIARPHNLPYQPYSQQKSRCTRD